MKGTGEICGGGGGQNLSVIQPERKGGAARERERSVCVREIIYLSLHCHHQNDSCIKMGSNENHFNVSVIVRDKVTRPCQQTTTFEKGSAVYV